MIERQVGIDTAEGRVNTFICHPERGGPHPLVIFYMDAPGIREELRDMVRRLASVGYYVMLPNLYYRSGEEEMGPFIGPAHAATRDRYLALMRSLTIPGVMADTDALIDYADGDPAASPGTAGTVGYCMSGQYALSAAARHPDWIRAAASVYGTWLLTERPDSPHRTVPPGTRVYVAYAELDHLAPAETAAPLQQALAERGVPAEVEVYPAVDHAFAFPQRPVYDRAAAERHWERLFELFGATLRA
ncbi:dienelactone hydrolase family protein [Roseomonas elaeocarpi]|uniref:Dienelactone hydrolase family protein n=1 Tax=Roseomonas elaeocarpi TaxID=907779 RepID=A0ABV6JW70_9PROT